MQFNFSLKTNFQNLSAIREWVQSHVTVVALIPCTKFFFSSILKSKQLNKNTYIYSIKTYLSNYYNILHKLIIKLNPIFYNLFTCSKKFYVIIIILVAMLLSIEPILHLKIDRIYSMNSSSIFFSFFSKMFD